MYYPYLQLMYSSKENKGEHTTCTDACMSLNNEEHLAADEPLPNTFTLSVFWASAGRQKEVLRCMSCHHKQRPPPRPALPHLITSCRPQYQLNSTGWIIIPCVKSSLQKDIRGKILYERLVLKILCDKYSCSVVCNFSNRSVCLPQSVTPWMSVHPSVWVLETTYVHRHVE